MTWSSNSRRIVTLGEAVLPGCSRRDLKLFEPHADEPPVEHAAEDPIAITDDAVGDDVGRHR